MRGILKIIVSAFVVVFIEFIFVIFLVGAGLGCAYDPCPEKVIPVLILMVVVPILAIVFLIWGYRGGSKAQIGSNAQLNKNDVTKKVFLFILFFVVFIILALLLNRYWWMVTVYVSHSYTYDERCIRYDCPTPVKDLLSLF